MRTPLPANQSRKPLDLEGVSWRLGMSAGCEAITWDGEAVGQVLPTRTYVVHRGGLRQEVQHRRATVTLHGQKLTVECSGGWNKLCDEVIRRVDQHFRDSVHRRDWPPLVLMATPDEAAQIRAGQRENLYYPWSDRYGAASCWSGRPVEVWAPKGECLRLTMVGAVRYGPEFAAGIVPWLVRRHPKAKAFAAVALNLETLEASQVPAGVSPGGEAQTAG